MTTRVLIFSVLAAALAFTGCQKDDDDTAGKGGSATMRVRPLHQTVFIDSCRVYLKYNAQNAPADGRYDDSADIRFVGPSLPKMALFANMRTGNYYIYGYGYDTIVHKVVKGGTPFYVDNKQPQFEIVLPVK